MVAVLGCLLAAHLLRAFYSVDQNIITIARRFGIQDPILNKYILATSEITILTGGLLVGLIWYLWFETKGLAARESLFAGFIAVLLTAIFARVLQLSLPGRLRPVHNLMSGFPPPPGIDPAELSNWGSFPSDHAMVFFALVAVIWKRSRLLGLLALASSVFGTVPRVYLGLHYFNDVAGGAIMGMIVVSLLVRFMPRESIRWGISWATRRSGLFYGSAFIIAFEVATLFEDIRRAGRGIFHLLIQLKGAHPLF